MDPDEDMEDIKRLNDIIKAENSAKEDNINFGLLESESSDSEESDNDYSSITNHKAGEEKDFSEVIITENKIQNTQFDNLHDLSNLAPHLTYEEFQFISNCEDPTLKKLLILNRVKKVQLKYLNNKYYNLLLECDNNLKFEREKLARTNDINSRSKSNNFAKIGCPYFRDTRQFPAPPNADIIKKKRNFEVNCSYFPKKKVWNICNQISLKSNVMLHYFKSYLSSLEEKLREARQDKDVKRQFSIKREIDDWKDDFNGLEPPDFWDDTHINWEDIALKQFNDVLSASACRGFWNLYVHPWINKSPILDEEKAKLLELVAKYKEQNWDAIAKELGNNRSPYLLCVEYFSKQAPKKNTREGFTKEEDEQMLKLIEANRVGNRVPWRKIAYHLDNRSKTCLYHRYRYSLEGSNYKLGKFSESEDILLMCLAKKHNEDFNKIATEMPHRTKSKLYNRYFGYLKSTPLNLGNWTVEEDRKILEHVREHGARMWIDLSKDVERASCHLRHRYFFLKKRIATTPNFSLEDLPRKSFRNYAHVSRVKRAQYSVEHYMQTNTLPTLDVAGTTVQEERASNRGRPQREHIDHQLTNYFRSTAHIRKERHRKTISLNSIEKCAQSVRSILDILGVKLKIPDGDEIDDHPDLNQIDKEVLHQLKTINPSTQVEHPLEVTPNVNSIQALRCLLLKYREFKDLSRHKGKIVPSDDAEVQLHRRKFAERFRALFRWPCLMSIVDPPEEVDIVKTDEEVGERMMMKRVGRPMKNLTKIQKMNEARLKSKKLRITASTGTSSAVTAPPITPIVLNGSSPLKLVSVRNRSNQSCPATVKSEPPAPISYQAGPWRIKQEPAEAPMHIKQEPKYIQDEELVDDPDVNHIECVDPLASTSDIDLPINLNPSDTQVDLHLPSISSNTQQNPTHSVNVQGTEGIMKMINKNTFFSPQQKIIRKVSTQELAELKKKGNKFIVLKSFKRPAGGNDPCLVDVKRIKGDLVNVCKAEK